MSASLTRTTRSNRDASAATDVDQDGALLARVEGLELLGPVTDSGYEQGAALVRRADGQMVQLGPLMYTLLEEIDGRRDATELARAMCERLGRACDERHVTAIARKLHQQGLLAGSESNAPERTNPLLALRWKVLVTDPAVTRRLTSPFTALFRPWVAVPVVAAFLAVCWFVLVEQGVAAAAAEAFDKPELILLVFALGVGSAAFHEIGHAAACRYGGGAPGGMGMGIYMVWPAFYTDVTDAYRLPRRDRLRTDLGGLYFNAVVAVATLGAWMLLRVDALLLLIGLQLLEMVKQLSPVIRADGYHILADATGVPDLYAHIGPTLGRLVPGRGRAPSALTGRARVIVTLWVLVVVPVLLAMALSAILVLPRLAASTWESGGQLLSTAGAQAGRADVVGLLVSMLRLLGLALPLAGVGLMARRIVSGSVRSAAAWSAGRPGRRALVAAAALGVTALLAWTWWPAGQYQPVRASDRGTIVQASRLVAAPASAVRPDSSAGSASSADRGGAAHAAPPPTLTPGRHLAMTLIPEGGPSEENPAIFVIQDPDSDDPVVIASAEAPPTSGAPSAAADAAGDGAAADPSSTAPPATASTPDVPATPARATTATAFTFALPDAPRANDSQALAVNRTDGGTTYTVAYSLVTVRDGDPVDERNGAYAFANCTACTTVAVSFQLVLVVGTSNTITPINIAEALNGNCPSCVTTAIANQIVVSVTSEPPPELVEQLTRELERLDAIEELPDGASPQDVLGQVVSVRQAIEQRLTDSGLLAQPPSNDASSSPATTTGEPDAASTTPEAPQAAPDAPATEPATSSDPTAPSDATTGTATTQAAPGATSSAQTGETGNTTTTTPAPSDSSQGTATTTTTPTAP